MLSIASTEYPESVECLTVVFSVAIVSSALGSGRLTVKRLPLPGLLFTVMLPFNSFTVSLTMASPNPKPSSVTELPSRSNGTNIRSCCSFVMPVPVSDTDKVNMPLVYSVVNVTLPFGVGEQVAPDTQDAVFVTTHYLVRMVFHCEGKMFACC